jgi:hypothetical protein
MDVGNPNPNPNPNAQVLQLRGCTCIGELDPPASPSPNPIPSLNSDPNATLNPISHSETLLSSNYQALPQSLADPVDGVEQEVPEKKKHADSEEEKNQKVEIRIEKESEVVSSSPSQSTTSWLRSSLNPSGI